MDPASSDSRQPFDDQGSFSARYRGTQWGQPLPGDATRGTGRAPVTAADASLTRYASAGIGEAPRRGRPEIVLFAAIGMVLVMAVAFGAVIMTLSSSPAGIPQNVLPAGAPVAAASASPNPSVRPSVSPSSSPSASNGAALPPPTGTELPTPTPLPSPVQDSDDVLAAMAHVLRDLERPHQMTVASVIRSRGARISIDGHFEVSGRDLAGRYDFSGSSAGASLGVASSIQVVYVDGKVYAKVDDRQWSSAVAPSRGFSTAMLTAPDLPLLRYKGVTERDGVRLHRFGMADPDRPAVLAVLEASGDLAVRDVEVELLVDDAGQPAFESLAARITTRGPGGRSTASLDMDVSYGQWGVPVTIEAPRDRVSG